MIHLTRVVYRWITKYQLATNQDLDYLVNCKALFETPCIILIIVTIVSTDRSSNGNGEAARIVILQ
jgi:hypothetical protein